MHSRRRIPAAALAAATACAILGAGIANAATTRSRPTGLVRLADTAPDGGAGAAMPAASVVDVSVLAGRDQAGLAAAARAISDPASHRYQRYLSTAQVAARFGATPAQQAAVSGWLTRSGLTVTQRGPFAVDAYGTVARAQTTLHTRLGLQRPPGGTEQATASQEMSVPAGIASSVSTIQITPATVPVTPHEPLAAARIHVRPAAHGQAAAAQGTCSSYYGQVKATGLPSAYGRTLSWAPCGYTPQQLRGAYGAARSGLTGAGVSVAVLSEDAGQAVLSQTNRWAARLHVPPLRPGQYSSSIARGTTPGTSGEDALDVQAVHGMAPAAHITFVAGNGKTLGGRLLDALNTVVTHHLADVVTSSWYVGWLPEPQSMITAWEGVLERAAVEGITVDFASGDSQEPAKIQYPGGDPWLTAVGGTSLAVGAKDNYLWETGWEGAVTSLDAAGTAWVPAPPGGYDGGATGGLSSFAEPYYQRGVVSGNVVAGLARRAVPDVSDLADPYLGYLIGTVGLNRHGKLVYFIGAAGGTSLSSPLFAGFEADLVQGRHRIPLGFANPALYNMAGTRAFHNVTSYPQGQGVPEAVAIPGGPHFPVALSTMGECASTPAHLTCGTGYNTGSGIGSPGPSFFSSFGSHPLR
jgi:subtilase family serine protease